MYPGVNSWPSSVIQHHAGGENTPSWLFCLVIFFLLRSMLFLCILLLFHFPTMASPNLVGLDMPLDHGEGSSWCWPSCSCSVPAKWVPGGALQGAGQGLQFLRATYGQWLAAAHHLLLPEPPTDHGLSDSLGVVLVLAGWSMVFNPLWQYLPFNWCT